MPKAVEYRELKDDELSSRLNETRQELFNLRFRHATGQLDNTARLKDLRKDVARLSYLVRERELVSLDANSNEGEK